MFVWHVHVTPDLFALLHEVVNLRSYLRHDCAEKGDRNHFSFPVCCKAECKSVNLRSELCCWVVLVFVSDAQVEGLSVAAPSEHVILNPNHSFLPRFAVKEPTETFTLWCRRDKPARSVSASSALFDFIWFEEHPNIFYFLSWLSVSSSFIKL